MTERACLEKSVLVVETRSSRRSAESRRRMALQAQQVDIAYLQHVRVWPAMRDVAGLAAFELYCFVLEHEWTLFVDMARKADNVLRRGCPDLLRFHRAVHIVTVTALNEALVHAMVKGHVELRLLLQVTPVAKLRLGFYEQELRFFRVVG
jgi:hypothetical protein